MKKADVEKMVDFLRYAVYTGYLWPQINEGGSRGDVAEFVGTRVMDIIKELKDQETE